MAELGGTDLDKPFGFWTATALVMGGMIGAGIFILPAQMASYGATGVVGWVVAIVGAMCLGLVIAGLVQARPIRSGLVGLCGDALGPMPGIFIGWAYWISDWAGIAVMAGAASSYLAVFFPVIAATPLSLAITSIAIVWAITLLNLAGLRLAGHFQVVTTVLKILPLVAVLVILAAILLGGGQDYRAVPHAPFMASQLTPALTLVLFALVGFESAALASERVRNARLNVPLATLLGVGLVGLLYLTVSAGIVYAMPQDELSRSGSPIADFVARHWGSGAGLAVAAFAAISAIGCLNAWLLIQGEMPLDMVRSGLLPPAIGQLNRRGVAWLPVVVSSLCSSLLLLSNVSRGTAGLFDFMIRLTSATNLMLYIGICVVAWLWHRQRVAATLGLLFSLWALWGAGLDVAFWGLILMATAAPLYWLRPNATGRAG